ncbi:MAG: FAD-dependent monooxygenase [Pseudolabrys sp.]|nr:FAD-dependent monooxygenase [Pseudolabrys sp.]
MSGLLAGLLLRRAGWDVEIFEKVETELSGRGAGIVAQPELVAHLASLGLDTRDLGVNAPIRRIVDRSGRVTEHNECPQIFTAWERVYRLLRDAFPPDRYHRGRGLERFEQGRDRVVAYFANDETAEADVLIGADGVRSNVRQQLLPDVTPRYVGYSAWRALLNESEIPAELNAELFAGMTFGLPPGEQFLGYPVAGPDNDLRVGHRRYNVIWYRPADETKKLPWLLTDDSGKTHVISIPPPLIRRAAIEEMREAAERLLAPQFRKIVRLVTEPILQPIYDLESPRMAIGRVAVIGDASFVARPHVGAGVAKAADDAAALVAALGEEHDIPAALKRFEKARLSINRRIVEYARHLGAYLQATRTAEEQSRAGPHSTDRAVIEETALLDFLKA